MNSSIKEICFNKPVRPALVKAINGLNKVMPLSYLNPLVLDKILNKVKRKTGLSDFGDDRIFEGLRILLDSIQKGPKLTGIGTLVASQMIQNSLINRLQFVDHHKNHPEIENEVIERPIFILGLPRTGTTLLHYLISLDDNHRYSPNWESFHPCPPVQAQTFNTDFRINKTKLELAFFWQLIPNIRSVHNFDNKTPQECIVFMSHTMTSFAIPTQLYIQEYMQWLQESDLTFLYQEHKRTLQLMQSGGHRKKRWALKAPAHIFCIDQILDIYPDACIIQTHREPVRAIASSSSLNYALAQLTSDEIALSDVGKLHMRVLSDWLEINVEQRRNHEDKKDQFYDLSFHSFVSDPKSEIKKIYDQFGFEYTKDFDKNIDAYIDSDQPHKYGKHIYSPEQFGLDANASNEKLEKYVAYFKDYLQV